MGFDITAYDDDDDQEVAYYRTYMGGFRMMKEQGYDWFDLIDAYDCYGGVSGNGKDKQISVLKLRNALNILKSFKVDKLSSEGRDEISESKEYLIEFMEKCIKWCEDNDKKTSILIYFG